MRLNNHSLNRYPSSEMHNTKACENWMAIWIVKSHNFPQKWMQISTAKDWANDMLTGKSQLSMV